MAAIRPLFGGAGAKTAATTAATAVAGPTVGYGDLEIMVAECAAANTITITNNGGGAWTLMSGLPVSVTGGEKLYVWYRINKPGDSDPSLQASADHFTATRLRYVAGSFDPVTPFESIETGTEVTSDTSFSFATAGSTAGSDRLCLVVSTILRDSNTASVPVCTNANMTNLNSRANYNTSNGNGGGFGVTEGTRAAAGAIGTWACTYGAASPKSYVSFAIRPADTGLGITAIPSFHLRADYLTDVLGMVDNASMAGGAWPDVSGKDHPAGTSAGAPLLKTNQIGGKPAVDLPGSAFFIINGATLATLIGAAACTIFAVFQADSYSSGGDTANGAILADAGGFFGLYGFSPDQIYLNNWDGSSDNATASGASTGSPHRVQARHEAGSIFAKIDGGSEASVASGSTTDLTNAVWIGSGQVSLWDGRLAELIVFNTALSSGDRATVETYLINKYFVTPIHTTLTPATEADSAVAQSVRKPIHKTLTNASETDSAIAQSVRKPKHVALTAATETDTAQALSIRKPKHLTLTPATETDTNLGISVHGLHNLTLVPALEADSAVAQVIRKVIHKVLTPATEADTAQALSVRKPKRISLTPASELDSALALAPRIIIPATPLFVREPSWLAATIELHGGTNELRFGPDEASEYQMPVAIETGSEVPGGDGPGSLVLPRPRGFDPFDGQLFAKARIYDAAGRHVQSGRISSMPQTGVNEVTVELQGLAKDLEMDETAAVIFADKDISAWEAISTTERQQQVAGQVKMNDATVEHDVTIGHPALRLGWESNEDGWYPRSIAVYDAGAARVGYQYVVGVPAGGANPVAMFLIGFEGSDDLETVDSQYSSDLYTSGNFSAYYFANKPSRYAVLWFQWQDNGTWDGYGPVYVHANPIVYGDHNLPMVGDDPVGFRVSDMVRYTVQKFAPSLKIDDTLIEPTPFVVPHASFREETTAKDIIEQLALFGGGNLYPLDWGVYDDKFWLASPGNYGRTWRVRKDEGAAPIDSGPDASRVTAAAKVVYDDGSGKKRSVGFPGSNSDLETAQLIDQSVNSIALRAGLPLRKRIDAGVLGSDESAQLLGQMVMQERNRDQWRGEINVEREDGLVYDENGAPHPIYMMRAGDSVVVEDEDTEKAQAPRRITQITSDEPLRAAKLTVGPDPDRFDTILARLGVVITDLGVT